MHTSPANILLVILLSLSINGMAKDMGQDSNTPMSFFVEAPDGVKIHYRVVGQGTPVLLLHGYYANEDVNWFQNAIATELAKTNKVIAVDLRGHGKSDKPITKSSYGKKMWKDVILVLDHAKIPAAHVHGYSMGGSILIQLLRYHPKRVLSAQFGGSGIPVVSKKDKENIEKDKEVPEEIEALEKDAEKVIMAEGPDHLALYALRKNPPYKGEAKYLDLTKLKIPVLAINGEFDGPNAKTYRMQKELPNFRSVVLPGKGHLTAIVPGFMPQEYLTETVNFIRSQNN